MDNSWIQHPGSRAYIEGVTKFIEFAKAGSRDGCIICPCTTCKVGRNKWFPVDVVLNHHLHKGFFKSYTNWIFHGPNGLLDNLSSDRVNTNVAVNDQLSETVGQDDVEGMLNDAFGVHESYMPEGLASDDEAYENADLHGDNSDVPHCFDSPEDEARYKKLLGAANEELYPGSTNFSKLSFLLRIFHLKCMFKWSARSVSLLFELLVDAFRQMTAFPSTYYEAEKMIKELGLGYQTIDACPKNHMLFWGGNADKTECDVCHTARWKVGKETSDNTANEKDGQRTTRIPAKVLRYFPLIPRLKRMYMSSKIAENLRWHDKGRTKDGILRHPADGLAWKELDSRFPEKLASDPRRIRFGLASDGFNPYKCMSSTYSTWPVVLINYNLPPWLCMKSSSLILSMIIPGKSGPGNYIDIYLQPLLHELKQLWEGVNAFDAFTKEYCVLKGALLWTVNDFPAYAMLSGPGNYIDIYLQPLLHELKQLWEGVNAFDAFDILVSEECWLGCHWSDQ